MIGFAAMPGMAVLPKLLHANEEIGVEGLVQARRFLGEHRRPARVVVDYLNLIHVQILVSRDASATTGDEISIRRVRQARRES